MILFCIGFAAGYIVCAKVGGKTGEIRAVAARVKQWFKEL